MVEGARLESVYTLIAYRGFESLSLRQTTHPIRLLTSEIQGEIVAGIVHMAFMAHVVSCLGKYDCFLKLVDCWIGVKLCRHGIAIGWI